MSDAWHVRAPTNRPIFLMRAFTWATRFHGIAGGSACFFAPANVPRARLRGGCVGGSTAGSGPSRASTYAMGGDVRASTCAVGGQTVVALQQADDCTRSLADVCRLPRARLRRSHAGRSGVWPNAGSALRMRTTRSTATSLLKVWMSKPMPFQSSSAWFFSSDMP